MKDLHLPTIDLSIFETPAIHCTVLRVYRSDQAKGLVEGEGIRPSYRELFSGRNRSRRDKFRARRRARLRMISCCFISRLSATSPCTRHGLRNLATTVTN